jgi:TolB-like protein/Tfp pilus assembly protein PilF
MVSEQAPFRGETTADIIGLIMHKEPVQLTAYDDLLPAELDRIVRKALAKDKEDRYQVVKDLGIDLKSLKRSLEFESALERTGSPNIPTRERSANTAAISAQFSNSQVHTTSSAEYIATGIQRHKLAFAAAAVLLLAVIGGLSYFFLVGTSGPSINSVAVLPFVNTGGDPNFEYVSDGVSEAIINNLSQLQQLKVISRASTWKYKGKEVDVAEVARALGVGAVVMGRVVQRGDDLQISVEMVNAADGTQIFGEQFTRKANELQGLQSQISRDIAEKLRLRLTGSQEQQLAKMPTQNPQAYQLYLTGLFYSRKGNTEDIKKALDYFTQAVALDPQFALAYASMPAQFSNLSTSGADPKELLAKGRAAAQKAVELDDTLADAHNALALIKKDEWDWAAAESEFKRAIELNPNHAGAHGGYANYLALLGRNSEALAENQRSQELDPLRIAAKANEGLILYFGRRYDEAIQVYQNVIKIQPDYSFAHAGIGYTYSAKGMYAEAIAAHQKEIDIDGETTSTLCFLGFAHAMSGKRTEAISILEKLKTTKEHVSPAELAVVHIGLGDKDAAMAALERSYQDRDLQLQYLKVEPHFDPLRSDPRFQDLVRRVGLP